MHIFTRTNARCTPTRFTNPVKLYSETNWILYPTNALVRAHSLVLCPRACLPRSS